MNAEPFDLNLCLAVLDDLPERLRLITARVQDALFCEGAQQKQGYLVEIAELLGLDVSGVDRGIAE